MSVEVFITGVTPKEGIEKKYQAYKACKEAGIVPPKKLVELFEEQEACEKGILTNYFCSCVNQYINDKSFLELDKETIYLNLEKLKEKYPDVKLLKIDCSY